MIAVAREHPGKLRARRMDTRMRTAQTRDERPAANGPRPSHRTPEAHSAMSNPTTMLTGPLSSTIHVLRADAGTIAERMEAVTGIVRRRRGGSVRVREEETPYHASP